ncbi:MAG: fibro-slime domain-containing protein [Agathobacter sp.]|nr:fibro-slime domain-containing protein [Agathobacter sp.]
MRKIKLCKRIIAFLLVLTFIMPGSSQNVYAQNDETTIEEESSSTVGKDSSVQERDEDLDDDILATSTNAKANASTDTSVDTSENISDNSSENVSALSENTAIMSGDVYYFSANLFDYDRDIMNQATMNMVAEDIQKKIDSGELDGNDLENKAKLRGLYPSLLFVNSHYPGDKSGTYNYVSSKTGKIKTARVRPAYFYTRDLEESENTCWFNINNSGNNAEPRSYQGMVKDRLGSDGLPQFNVITTDLFNKNINNKTSYTNVKLPFTFDEEGYFLLDSRQYTYSLGEDGIIDREAANKGRNNFLPLGSDNFHFGMNFGVEFVMSEDGKYRDNDCVFEFSGDDDVWVFIDGKLALDLGGIHSRCEGKINFAQQTVTYSEPTNNNGQRFDGVKTVNFNELGLNTNDNGKHYLQFFYLERGASASNCKLKFNLPTEVGKTSKLKDWQDRTYEITLDADPFKNTRTDDTSSNNADSVSDLKGDIIDIVDCRFEITEDSRAFLIDDGAEIVDNSDYTTTITWKNQTLRGWVRKFKIKARDSYIGGNNVPTNDPASKVIIKKGEKKTEIKFPEPKVNVRIDMQAGWAEDEIFLGQSLERYFNLNQLNKMLGNTKGIDNYIGDVTGVLKYSWYENGRLRVGSCDDFSDYIRSLYPRLDSQSACEEILEEKMQGEPEGNPYKNLYITFKPVVSDDSQEAEAAAESMKPNDNDPAYTACMSDEKDETINDITVHGRYYVTIIDGKITVNKTYDHSFLTDLIYSKDEIEAIDARQTAAFTIYKYAEDASIEDIANGNVDAIESYDITITGDGNQTITGLEAGMYKVVENTSWTWKYNASVKETNDSTTDGIFYIGKQSPNASAINADTVSFENKLDRELSKIYSDTTNILNSFLGN